MIFAGFKELSDHINTGILLPIYLFYGEDRYRITTYKDKLVKAAADVLPDVNLDVFDSKANDFAMSEVLNSALTAPFGAEKRCVIIDNLTPDALPAAEFQKLKELLEHPCDTTALLLITQEQMDKADASSRIRTLYSLCKNNGGVCRFAAAAMGDNARLASKTAAGTGFVLDSEQAQMLVEYCGGDLLRVTREIEKLTAYKGKDNEDKKITSEDIELLVTPVIEARTFDLCDRILRADIAGALKTIDNLCFLKENPTSILSILSMSFVDIYRAAAAREYGVSESKARRDYGYGTNYRYTKALTWASRCDLKTLGKILRILERTDNIQKTAGANTRAALENAVVEITELLPHKKRR